LVDKLAVCVQPFVDTEVLLTIHAAQVVGAGLNPIDNRAIYSIASNLVLSPMEESHWFTFNGFAMIFRASLLEYTEPYYRKNKSLDGLSISCHDIYVYFVARALGKVALLSDKLVLYRQHESNASVAAERKKSLKERATISLNNGQKAYLSTVFGCRRRVDILRTIKDSATDVTIKNRADKAMRFWSRIALANEYRATLYSDSNKIKRLRTLIVLTMTFSYRSYHRRGFGLWGLAKDITIGLFGLHRAKERGEEAESLSDSS
jgi:hypothetical protein